MILGFAFPASAEDLDIPQEIMNMELRGTGDCLSIDSPENAAFCAQFPGFDTLDDLATTCATTEFSVCAVCVNEFATEVVDGVDNDCDGTIDEIAAR